ncbi:hypothetical protein [Stenotrophomonas rhizophila]|uniref:hypothetical protein n=1 Tax=Stenotrophomonas rhizophila TaxID=216778 RepID=UPI003396C66E
MKQGLLKRGLGWLLPIEHPRIAGALLALGVVVMLVARLFSWPGFATHDTVFITQEALRGEYTSYHPVLNALLIRWLAVPFESFSIYTTLQIVFCGTLYLRSATLFARMVNRPVWILLGVALWAAMPSTYLYLGMIWKDVLCAYCLLFLATLVLQARQTGVLAGRGDAVLLGLSLFLIVATRHGMAINFLLLPLAIGARRLWAARPYRAAFVAAVVGWLFMSVITASPLVKNDVAHLNKLKISAVSGPFLGMVSNRSGYTSNDPGQDQALAARVFGPDYAEKYRPDYLMNEVVLTDAQELDEAYRLILRRTARLCLLNVSQCGSDRLQMMLATLQPSTAFGGMKFYDLAIMENCPKVFGMDPDKCDVLERFERGERPSMLVDFQRKFVSRFVDTRGTTQNLFVWNLLPAFVLLLSLLVFSAPRRPLWILSLFILTQMVLPIATSMANDFRYYYFLAPLSTLLAVFVIGRMVHGHGFWHDRPMNSNEATHV